MRITIEQESDWCYHRKEVVNKYYVMVGHIPILGWLFPECILATNDLKEAQEMVERVKRGEYKVGSTTIFKTKK